MPSPLDNFSEDECRRLLGLNFTWKRIAEHVGCSEAAVKMWAKRRNIRKYAVVDVDLETEIRAFVQDNKNPKWGYRFIKGKFVAERNINVSEEVFERIVRELDPEGMRDTVSKYYGRVPGNRGAHVRRFWTCPQCFWTCPKIFLPGRTPLPSRSSLRYDCY